MTNWRTYGDVYIDTWVNTILDAGGPTELASGASYEAARPHSALVLSMMGVECRWGTTENLNKLANKNVLNLKQPLQADGTREPGFMAFPTWAAGIKAAVNRITSPTYGGGVYAETVTVADLINVFAPRSENDTEAYVAFVERHIAQWETINAPTGGSTDVADLVFGKVPLPPIQVRDITNKPEGTGWDDLGQRHPYGVVLHRMLGTLRGTDSYFRQDGVGALTDFGVGVDGSDAKADDGVIMRWNDPNGRRAGWASGPVSSPYGDGLAFVNTFGINAVNRDLVSIEISGFQTTPLTSKSRAAIMGLMAYYADQKHVAWDKYPIGPDGFSVVYYHEEFTLGTGKRCPFDVVKDETASLIEGARAILKKYQTASDKPTPTPPTYAAPKPPAFLTDDLKQGYPEDHKVGDLVYYGALRTYEAVKAANRLQGPDTKAPKIGPRLAVRERFRGSHIVKKDGRLFVLTPFGTYIDAAALTPRIAIRNA